MTQSVSRSSQPIAYYLSSSNEAIDLLTKHYGDSLQSLNAQQLCLMAGAINDHMAGEAGEGDGCYTPQDSLHCIDPDCLLGVALSLGIVAVMDESDAEQMTELLIAIAFYQRDRARAGAWGSWS